MLNGWRCHSNIYFRKNTTRLELLAFGLFELYYFTSSTTMVFQLILKKLTRTYVFTKRWKNLNKKRIIYKCGFSLKTFEKCDTNVQCVKWKLRALKIDVCIIPTLICIKYALENCKIKKYNMCLKLNNNKICKNMRRINF